MALVFAAYVVAEIDLNLGIDHLNGATIVDVPVTASRLPPAREKLA